MLNYSNTAALQAIDASLAALDACLDALEGDEALLAASPRVYRALVEQRQELLQERQEARVTGREDRAPARSPEPGVVPEVDSEQELLRELEFRMQLDGRPSMGPCGRIQGCLDELDETYPADASTTRRGLVLRLMGWRRLRQFARSATVRDGAFAALCDARLADLAERIAALA